MQPRLLAFPRSPSGLSVRLALVREDNEHKMARLGIHNRSAQLIKRVDLKGDWLSAQQDNSTVTFRAMNPHDAMEERLSTHAQPKEGRSVSKTLILDKIEKLVGQCQQFNSTARVNKELDLIGAGRPRVNSELKPLRKLLFQEIQPNQSQSNAIQGKQRMGQREIKCDTNRIYRLGNQGELADAFKAQVELDSVLRQEKSSFQLKMLDPKNVQSVVREMAQEYGMSISCQWVQQQLSLKPEQYDPFSSTMKQTSVSSICRAWHQADRHFQTQVSRAFRAESVKKFIARARFKRRISLEELVRSVEGSSLRNRDLLLLFLRLGGQPGAGVDSIQLEQRLTRQ